jgi:hypothetical protein
VEIRSPGERDAQFLQLRLAGVSIGTIAHRYKVRERVVLKALDKLLPTLDAATRARYLRESLGTLDMLQSWWTSEAKRSATACSLVLKIQEQRSTLLGLNAPIRLDPIQVVAAAAPEESSTQLLP